MLLAHVIVYYDHRTVTNVVILIIIGTFYTPLIGEVEAYRIILKTSRMR